MSVGLAQIPALAQPQVAAAGAVTISAGTRIDATLIRPVFAATASPGETIYAQTSFPVVAGGRTVVPPGTFVEGRLEKLTRPTRRSNRAELQILFSHLIFANGYVAALQAPAVPAQESSAAGVSQPGSGGTLIAVAAQVSTRNDLLLDNGALIEITLGAPLELNAEAVAAAIPLSRAPVPGQIRSATRCVAIPGTPGTPGTPDTVIPGTPGTPDTVIPGGPGMADTVIPGTPATPSTTIPGTSGTPGTPEIPCPMPPVVISSTPVVGTPVTSAPVARTP